TQDRRPRFSFFHIQLSKNRQANPRQQSNPAQPKSGKKTSVSANFWISSEPVRWALRRRLSFGEAAYTATPFSRQQPFVKKLSFFPSN
ncbi:hypothetical protein MKJ03_19025, partial (plasmid) [Rhizobium sp. SSM4.3]